MTSDDEFEVPYNDISGEEGPPGGGGGGGMFGVNVSAGGLPEVGGRPEVYQVREPATTTNAREVLFTHCGLKVHSHYSV